MSIASLSPPTPYTALMSLLSVALSSVTAKSSSMIPSDPSRVNIQPARKHCSTCPEAVLNFHGIDAQLRRFRCAFLTAYAVDKDHLTEQLQRDITAQFALNILIDTDDNIQMSEAGGRVYSMDFSEAFYVSDTMMLKAFLFNKDAGRAWADNKLDAFCDHIRWLSFDVAREFAPELHMNQEKMKAGMITVAKKVLEVTDEEIDTLADELSKMYPAGYADYYAGCIYAMQERMKMF